MLRLILLTFTFVTSVVFAQNMPQRDVSAFLELKEDVQSLEVGGTYEFQLDIVNVSLDEIDSSMIESKKLIDFFYVLSVRDIGVSPNNADAITVQLELIITKAFEPKDFYIWQLRDRNIPLKIRNLSQIQDTQLNAKSFLISDIENYSQSRNLYYYLIAILLIGLFLSFYFLYNKKNGPRKSGKIKLLKKARTREDLEMLYRLRRDIKKELPSGQVKSDFESFIKLYENEQFSKSWHEKDVTDLIRAKDEIVKGMNNGV